MTRKTEERHASRLRGASQRRLTDEQRYSFLSAASRELAATLDYEMILAGIASRPLPYLGDWCIVDIVEEGERLRRVAIVHPDPAKRHLVERLLSGWPPSRTDAFGVPSVATSGDHELVACIDDDQLARYAGEGHNLQILRELGVGSLLTVPMAAPEGIVGAITYVAEVAEAFQDADVELAMDLAALSALAVTNARMHRRVADAQLEAETERQEAVRLAALASRLNERLLISALHEMEAAEQSASHEESTSESMATLSHELRSPLTAIMGYTELLLGGQLGRLSTSQVGSLTRVTKAVEQIMRLVDQILLRARLHENREPLDLGPVNVAAIARETFDLIRPTAVRKDVVLVSRITDEPLVLSTDADKFRQILLNLLSNAIKFTDQGEVRLTVIPHPDGVEVQVSDTGCGIPAEEQKRIFDRFRQAESGPHRGGSGLGLTITKALVDLLGGSIALESEPGRGSTFTVRLPPTRPPSPDESPS